MHWVIKASTTVLSPPKELGAASSGLKASLAERAGRPHARTRRYWLMRRLMQLRSARWLRLMAGPRTARPATYVPWDAMVSPVAPDTSTAWCEDKAVLRAAILARTPMMVVPSGAAGAAVLDEVSKLDGIAFARLGRGDHVWESEVQPGDVRYGAVRPGDMAIFTGLVKAALDGISEHVDHLVVTVEGSGLQAPEILAVLQRLVDGSGPGGSRRVQVALAGGPELYIRMAGERLQALREEAQAEAGPDAMAIDAGPKAPLTGWQQVGAAAGVLLMAALIAGPLISLGSLGTRAELTMAAPVSIAAPVAAMAVPVTAVPALSPGQKRARQRREFEESLAVSGKDVRRLRAAERERLFQEYVAQKVVPTLRPGLAVADRQF